MVENLINDLLDLAKIENNKFKLNEEFYDLPTTLVETFSILQFWCNQKQIDLSADIDKPEHL
jgi:signal transduction histidine kinase